VLFTRHWGFTLDQVRVPVRWWHGDADHIVPHRHGAHCVERLPDAELFTMAGESHLGGLGMAQEILGGLLGERASGA
jgi:pimeloyl-ACP methyl ester carboxylesterase